MSAQRIEDPRRRPAPRARTALAVALAADVLQWVLVPLMAGGIASPLNDVVDVAVAITMIVLVGWNWAFLPTFLAELVPVMDLVPTWTIAVWLATRGRKPEPEPETPREPSSAEIVE